MRLFIGIEIMTFEIILHFKKQKIVCRRQIRRIRGIEDNSFIFAFYNLFDKNKNSCGCSIEFVTADVERIKLSINCVWKSFPKETAFQVKQVEMSQYFSYPSKWHQLSCGKYTVINFKKSILKIYRNIV